MQLEVERTRLKTMSKVELEGLLDSFNSLELTCTKPRRY